MLKLAEVKSLHVTRPRSFPTKKRKERVTKNVCVEGFFMQCVLIKIIQSLYLIERFSYDLEIKTREQNRNRKRTEIEPFRFVFRKDTNARGF